MVEYQMEVYYTIAADDAFPLRPDMMKSFRQADLTLPQRKIFNYRLSRARRIVENAFGIMASRILYSHINLQPENIEKAVKGVCALHNFLIKHSKKSYAAQKCFYREDCDSGIIISEGYNTNSSTMENLKRRNQGNTVNRAKIVREDFINYFCQEGRVRWQVNHIKNQYNIYL